MTCMCVHWIYYDLIFSVCFRILHIFFFMFLPQWMGPFTIKLMLFLLFQHFSIYICFTFMVDFRFIYVPSLPGWITNTISTKNITYCVLFFWFFVFISNLWFVINIVIKILYSIWKLNKNIKKKITNTQNEN